MTRRTHHRAPFALPSLAAVAMLCLSGAAHAAPPGAPTTTTTTTTETTSSPGPRDFRYEVGLYGGYYFFYKDHGLGRYTGDPSALSPKNSGVFGGRLGLHFTKWVTLEAEVYGSKTANRGGDTDIWILGYRGQVLVDLMPGAAFQPFILAGVGGITSIPSDTNVVRGDSDPVVHAGIGAKIPFSDRYGLRIDGRISSPPTFLRAIAKIGNETGATGPDFEILGSLYAQFGEVPKPVMKREVVVIAPPPNPDPDGDGILGSADKCPNVPEDKDGFEDDDGCPDPDNDNDGIPDALDKCPNQAETKNGIDDEDGCPEIDTDGDGILGSRDKCPDQPETFNNYQDEDGCPDEIPADVKKFTGVIQGINFKNKSAVLLPGSFPILDRAVKVLQDYPDTKMEISGHTDSRGKADYNRDLSQKRADSVKNYLVVKGIKAERLQSVGYGMDQPIADNKTERGRSKNRRTEFKLIH